MLNINKYMGSGKFYIFLEDSNNFQNLLKASIGMEKKILDFSPRFQNPPWEYIFNFQMISHPSRKIL